MEIVELILVIQMDLHNNNSSGLWCGGEGDFPRQILKHIIQDLEFQSN